MTPDYERGFRAGIEAAINRIMKGREWYAQEAEKYSRWAHEEKADDGCKVKRMEYLHKAHDRASTAEILRYLTVEIRALSPAEQVEPPRINIRCETSDGVVTGSTSLNVLRIEAEDDGSWTAITDHWPAQTRAASQHICGIPIVIDPALNPEEIKLVVPGGAAVPQKLTEADYAQLELRMVPRYWEEAERG